MTMKILLRRLVVTLLFLVGILVMMNGLVAAHSSDAHPSHERSLVLYLPGHAFYSDSPDASFDLAYAQMMGGALAVVIAIQLLPWRPRSPS